MQWVLGGITLALVHAQPCLDGVCTEEDDQTQDVEETMLIQKAHKLNAPDAIPGEANAAYGGINGGVTGGVDHGNIENDFDWDRLATFKQPNCKGVCRSPTNSYCYPVKGNLLLGPPCGVLTTGPTNNYGCFLNEPTQTCALCTMAQGYCCPYAYIPVCTDRKLPAPPSLQRAIIPGGVNAVYGGVNGGVTGGLNHGDIENDFDWDRLAAFKNPNCEEVCRSRIPSSRYPTNILCYPAKGNQILGPPCGVLPTDGPTDNYGCFLNEPTQTCALCTTDKAYCCPYTDIPVCDDHPHAVAN